MQKINNALHFLQLKWFTKYLLLYKLCKRKHRRRNERKQQMSCTLLASKKDEIDIKKKLYSGSFKV